MKPILQNLSALQVEVVHPSDLSDSDRAAWGGIREGHPDYHSPLLSPEFAILLGQSRPDARVALFRDETGLACVFAFFARPGGRGRPIGAPFADYSGPLLRPDFDIRLSEIVKGAGLAYWRSSSLVDPWDRFESERSGELHTQLIHLNTNPEVYLEERRKLHAKRFKNFRRLESQAGRDGHVLRFKYGAPDVAFLEALMALKSAQYRASGLVDLTGARLSREILQMVATSPNGFAVSLWSGDAFVSGHFGFKLGPRFHPWIAAYSPAFAQYSPGNLLLKQIVSHMPEMGISEYDLAEGHDHYKKYYTNSTRRVFTADVQVSANVGFVPRLGHSFWTLAGADREGAAAHRLRRRIDHISVCDDRLGARVSDILHAFRERGLRKPTEGHQTQTK